MPESYKIFIKKKKKATKTQRNVGTYQVPEL